MAARTRQLAQMAQQLMALAGERDVAVSTRAGAGLLGRAGKGARKGYRGREGRGGSGRLLQGLRGQPCALPRVHNHSWRHLPSSHPLPAPGAPSLLAGGADEPGYHQAGGPRGRGSWRRRGGALGRGGAAGAGPGRLLGPRRHPPRHPALAGGPAAGLPVQEPHPAGAGGRVCGDARRRARRAARRQQALPPSLTSGGWAPARPCRGCAHCSNVSCAIARHLLQKSPSAVDHSAGAGVRWSVEPVVQRPSSGMHNTAQGSSQWHDITSKPVITVVSTYGGITVSVMQQHQQQTA